MVRRALLEQFGTGGPSIAKITEYLGHLDAGERKNAENRLAVSMRWLESVDNRQRMASFEDGIREDVNGINGILNVAGASGFVIGESEDSYIVLTVSHAVTEDEITKYQGIPVARRAFGSDKTEELGKAELVLRLRDYRSDDKREDDLAILALSKDGLKGRRLTPLPIDIDWPHNMGGEFATLVSGKNNRLSTGVATKISDRSHLLCLIPAKTITGDSGSPYLAKLGKYYRAIGVAIDDGSWGAVLTRDAIGGMISALNRSPSEFEIVTKDEAVIQAVKSYLSYYIPENSVAKRQGIPPGPDNIHSMGAAVNEDMFPGANRDDPADKNNISYPDTFERNYAEGIPQEILGKMTSLTVGQRIEMIRKLRYPDDARNDFARLAGIPANTYLYIERLVDTFPHPRYLSSIAAALRIDPIYIMKGKALEAALAETPTVGERLLLLRTRLGLRQEDLAERLIKIGVVFKSSNPEVIRSTIAQWEGNKALPEESKQPFIVRLFGLDEITVFGNIKKKKTAEEKALERIRQAHEALERDNKEDEDKVLRALEALGGNKMTRAAIAEKAGLSYYSLSGIISNNEKIRDAVEDAIKAYKKERDAGALQKKEQLKVERGRRAEDVRAERAAKASEIKRPDVKEVGKASEEKRLEEVKNAEESAKQKRLEVARNTEAAKAELERKNHDAEDRVLQALEALKGNKIVLTAIAKKAGLSPYLLNILMDRSERTEDAVAKAIQAYKDERNAIASLNKDKAGKKKSPATARKPKEPEVIVPKVKKPEPKEDSKKSREYKKTAESGEKVRSAPKDVIKVSKADITNKNRPAAAAWEAEANDPKSMVVRIAKKRHEDIGRLWPVDDLIDAGNEALEDALLKLGPISDRIKYIGVSDRIKRGIDECITDLASQGFLAGTEQSPIVLGKYTSGIAYQAYLWRNKKKIVVALKARAVPDKAGDERYEALKEIVSTMTIFAVKGIKAVKKEKTSSAIHKLCETKYSAENVEIVLIKLTALLNESTEDKKAGTKLGPDNAHSMGAALNEKIFGPDANRDDPAYIAARVGEGPILRIDARSVHTDDELLELYANTMEWVDGRLGKVKKSAGDRLKLLLYEIAANAAKHTGTADLAVKKTAAEGMATIELLVTDEGPGIEDVQDTLLRNLPRELGGFNTYIRCADRVVIESFGKRWEMKRDGAVTSFVITGSSVVTNGTRAAFYIDTPEKTAKVMKKDQKIERFKTRIQNIRKNYYRDLDSLKFQNANEVIRLGSSFRADVTNAIRDLFAYLKVGEGITLIAAGSVARNEHVEGSDLDWYFVTDATPDNVNLIKRISAIFDEANIKFDEDILPRFDPRTDPRWVTIKDISELHEKESRIIPKTIATMDSFYIAGDRSLYDSVRGIYKTNNEARKIQIGEKIISVLDDIANGQLNPKEFDVKESKGMIFSVNEILWILQLSSGDLNLDWESGDPITKLKDYSLKGYLAEDDRQVLTNILCFYLLLRNSIVGAWAKYSSNATRYETEYSGKIADDVASRMGIESTGKLEALVSEYSAKVMEIAGRVSYAYKSSLSRRRQDPAVMSETAEVQSTKIHIENLEYRPSVPRGKILCHIIAESILPAGQRKMLNDLDIKTRGVEYSEKIVRLEAGMDDNFMDKLKEKLADLRKEYGDYTVEFDVACSDKKQVEDILNSGLGIKALAFKPYTDTEASAVQAEGIILALRALHSSDIQKLKAAFRFLGNVLSADLSAINDIDEFIKRAIFDLPHTKIEDYKKAKDLHDLIEKNIDQAA